MHNIVVCVFFRTRKSDSKNHRPIVQDVPVFTLIQISQVRGIPLYIVCLLSHLTDSQNLGNHVSGNRLLQIIHFTTKHWRHAIHYRLPLLNAHNFITLG